MFRATETRVFNFSLILLQCLWRGRLQINMTKETPVWLQHVQNCTRYEMRHMYYCYGKSFPVFSWEKDDTAAKLLEKVTKEEHERIMPT